MARDGEHYKRRHDLHGDLVLKKMVHNTAFGAFHGR